MAARYLGSVVVGAVLLIGSAAMAADYRPDDFLTLDLSKAVLSPSPLGPPAAFEPVAVMAGGGQANEPTSSEPKWARDDLKAAPKKIAVQRVDVPRDNLAHASRLAHVRNGEPRGTARTRLAHRRGSPLDAQALDTRIQSWPCKSGGGGICGWKQ
jgi:hypothetical protein